MAIFALLCCCHWRRDWTVTWCICLTWIMSQFYEGKSCSQLVEKWTHKSTLELLFLWESVFLLFSIFLWVIFFFSVIFHGTKTMWITWITCKAQWLRYKDRLIEWSIPQFIILNSTVLEVNVNLLVPAWHAHVIFSQTKRNVIY